MRFQSILMFVIAALGCILLPRPLGAATRSVDCEAGGTIAGALPDLTSGDTLIVRGTCNEAGITIPTAITDVTFEGNGTASIRNGITVYGRQITIRGFDITSSPGSINGINVFRGGAAVIDGNTIHDTQGHGINVAQNAWAVMINNTIRNNPGSGINVLEASAVRIGYDNPNQYGLPNLIEGNTTGVQISLLAVATIVGATIVGNRTDGIRVQRGSHASIRGTNISGNQGNGITVVDNSSVFLDVTLRPLPPNQTDPDSPNQGFGISCTVGGSVSKDLGTLAGVKGTVEFARSCVDNIDR